MSTTKRENQFPAGWDEKRVQAVLDHYENQTDEEAAAEDEAGSQEDSSPRGGGGLDLGGG